MADAAINTTINFVLGTAVSLAADRISMILGVKEELERLSATAGRIQDFLADADGKIHSRGVRAWLNDLDGVVFKAEYVLDELNYENLRQLVKYRGQPKEQVCFFLSFSCFSRIVFRWRLASKIRDINTNLDRINNEANKLELVVKYHMEAALPAADGASTSRQTDSILIPNVVGRASDESKIVDMMLSPSDKVVTVIPITGMGGLGKTTLAKSVYNNPRIDEHFGKKIWICLAKEIAIMELFKFILESLTRKKVEVDGRDAIVQKIREELEKKRYLVVLDDVWNGEEGLWDDFFNTLAGLNPTKGSWCLVTTRLKPVADAMSGHMKMNDGPYTLGRLADDECWSILKEKAIGGDGVPQELEKLKEIILRRCDGLPLAASLIGGLLRNKGKEKWQSIVEESLLDGDQGEIEQILKVSIDHLSPVSIKKCFAYCSIFPQDTEIEQDLLIELWMAEGFLQPGRQNESVMEEVGSQYLRILLQASLLDKVEEEERTYYKMHDLVHDFAKSILNPKSSNQYHYLALYSSEEVAENITQKISTSLRTLFLEDGISDKMLSKLKHLHVLKFSGPDVNVLPNSIGNLLHLRFLDISDSGITTLPEALCKLYNLQTLRIDGEKLEEGLPECTSNLISLRHLHYYHSDAELQMPAELGLLTGLQTLEFFNVGEEEGRGVEELGTLKDLKGSLVIRNLELVKGKEGAALAKLVEKSNLSWLVFKWGSTNRESEKSDEAVLEGLQPHDSLQVLEIQDFMGYQFPQWLMNLSKLVSLELKGCNRCTELHAGLGELPSLQHLSLRKLENLTCIGLSFYGRGSTSGRKFFPALKTLTLDDLGNLVEWKDQDEVRSTTGKDIDAFPLLERLYIKGCSQLTTAPTPSHFPSLQDLDIRSYCHSSLAEKVLNNITTLSSLQLGGSMSPAHQQLESLHLVKRPLNSEDGSHQESSLTLGNGCELLPSEIVERLCHFPSLRHLQVSHCPNVTSLRRLNGSTYLESLKLLDCENLRELPEDLYKFQALRDLSIDFCPLINLGEYPNKGQKSLLKSLESLTITECDELTSIPSEMLEPCLRLQNLQVYECPNLASFPLDLRQTPSLETLILTNCSELITDVPKGFAFLTGLTTLMIGPLLDYSLVDWSGLISASTLCELELTGMSDMDSLPHQLQYLTTLTSLSLFKFGRIKALPDWIGNLVSLKSLVLESCEELQYLPPTAAMRCLTKLTILRIIDCPLLIERCNSECGDDSEWAKISHLILDID